MLHYRPSITQPSLERLLLLIYHLAPYLLVFSNPSVTILERLKYWNNRNILHIKGIVGELGSGVRKKEYSTFGGKNYLQKVYTLVRTSAV